VFPFFDGCLKKKFNHTVCDLAVCFLFMAFFSGVLIVEVVFGCSHFSFWLGAVLELFRHIENKLLVVFCLIVVPMIF
jgi:hypothetical protein